MRAHCRAILALSAAASALGFCPYGLPGLRAVSHDRPGARGALHLAAQDASDAITLDRRAVLYSTFGAGGGAPAPCQKCLENLTELVCEAYDTAGCSRVQRLDSRHGLSFLLLRSVRSSP
jgi:hypothetical protein